MASLPTPKPRVVIIVGATATGKTQLALDIASAEGGEVVNADLVQMYRGLDGEEWQHKRSRPVLALPNAMPRSGDRQAPGL